MIKFYTSNKYRLEPRSVFLVDWDSIPFCNPGLVMSYSPIGQHSEASIWYCREAKSITKEQYLKTSAGLYTPEEYLAEKKESQNDQS